MRKLDTILDEIDRDLEVELLYMFNVIKEVISNGTLNACTIENESTFPKENDVKDVLQNIYEFSGTLYLVSSFFYFICYTIFLKKIIDQSLFIITYMSIELQKICHS